MEPNTTLDGFLVHPIDLVPARKNQINNLDKGDLTTTNMDGYNVHPIDLFLSNDNIKNNLNANKNIISNNPNFNNIPKNNNLGLMTYQKNMEEKNINFRESYDSHK